MGPTWGKVSTKQAVGTFYVYYVWMRETTPLEGRWERDLRDSVTQSLPLGEDIS